MTVILLALQPRLGTTGSFYPHDLVWNMTLLHRNWHLPHALHHPEKPDENTWLEMAIENESVKDCVQCS